MKNLNITHNIEIGDGDLEVYHGVAIDAKPVVEMKKGDSIVANFIRILMSFAGGIAMPAGIIGHYASTSNAYHSPSTIGTPSNVTSVAGPKTRFTVPSNSSWSTAAHVRVMGLTGDWAAANGVWAVVSSSSTTVDISLDSSLFGALSLANSPRLVKCHTANARSEQSTFGNPKIILGTSLIAVDVDDQGLKGEVWSGSGAGQLNYSTVNISNPASSGTEVEMSMATEISNDSGGSIGIKEAGIAVYGPDVDTSDYLWSLIARDLLTVTIADGKVATVTYKFLTALGAEGGLTKQFLDILAQQLYYGAFSNTVKDVTGAIQTDTNFAGVFMMAAAGGDNIPSSAASGVTGQWIGPQVGTGNTAVTTDDYKLQTRVAHGTGAGQLKYFGSTVENFLVGDTPGEASFDVVRFFENVSGGAIEIKETALYCGRNSSGNADEAYCIARHVLAAPVNVLNTEVVRVTYRFKVNV
jgi:hypothetical protein